MDHEMNADAELLQALLNEAPMTDDGPLTAKLLRKWTRKSLQTISDYRTGKIRSIPVHFWHLILAHFRDARIYDLFLGALDYDVIVHQDVPDLTGSRDMLAAAIEAMGKYHQAQVHLAEIIKDGRIDETDADALERFNRAQLEHRRTSAAIRKAVNAEFARNAGRAAR